MFIMNMNSKERLGAQVRGKFQLGCHKEIWKYSYGIGSSKAGCPSNTGPRKKYRGDWNEKNINKIHIVIKLP